MALSKDLSDRLQRRTIASFLDLVFCLVLSIYLSHLFSEQIYELYYQQLSIDPSSAKYSQALQINRLGQKLNWIPFFTAIVFAYHWAFETSPMKATFGKFLLGLYWSSPKKSYWRWVKRAALKTLIFCGPFVLFLLGEHVLLVFFVVFIFLGGNYFYALQQTEESSKNGQQLAIYDRLFDCFLQQKPQKKKR
ncbi:RDD family protein [Saprospira grandis]|uniref:RDD domain-containing protein n=1 Tax=Saprospira grandis (strain Lewin) TaxID=984262 RepID=H6L8I4_SAPGL|nr:RDD family protein [Saprospira grandis]AFC26709.1 hypothetical protein SGRA_3994 [Saprospira grandis str. Lewin]